MSLNELKGQIFHHLQVSHEGNDLNIRVRYNISPPPSVFFSELQIVDDNTWSMVVANLRHWGMMELFVNVIAVAGSDLPRPGSSRITKRKGTKSRRQPIQNTHDLVEDITPVVPYTPIEEPNSGDDDEFRVDNEARLEDIQEFSNIFLDGEGERDRIHNLVFSDETPFGDISGNDNFFNDDEFVDELGEDDDEDTPEVPNRAAWKLSGRSDTQPVPSFNDIDDIVGIIGDRPFFPSEDYANDDGLGVGTLYRSKAHLKWVVHDHHIKINRTFRMKKSNASVYTLICTSDSCDWRLYAVRRVEDGAFVIKTRAGPHTCLVTKNRPNHPHLTAPFMATIVRQNIKKNPRFTVTDVQSRVKQFIGTALGI
ncbi:hypothetical protein LUZ63_010944 [Rhynchospora breviuscula]|uniref:Transposase MuDR plant domain-containing protein n=1 Tax=Rhynchospora breviuscula TaxID=2022672 RepID=A0A9Q0CHV1_9POAL|nr:hypothetical protein LUZ63_010944 [Rhynchospora breviuscula]